jgi:phage I-like protein
MTLILNRDFQHPADGWYMIEPKGEHPNAASGVVQVIDEVAAQSIVTRFNRAAAEPHFAGMLVDHEHFSHEPDQETRAFGWLMAIANRADGIYGQIRWTETGQAAVDGGDYRFFSTEYAKADTAPAGPDRVRPLRLAGLTLTNRPNNKGGRPITNRNSDQLSASSHQASGTEDSITRSLITDQSLAGAAGAASVAATTTKTRNQMTNIATKLGLAAEASEEAVLAEVSKLMHRATEAEAAVLPFKNRVTALEAENRSLQDAQVESDLEAYRNRYAPEQRESYKALLVSNREPTLKVLQSLPEPAGATDGKAGAGAGRSLLCNRAAAKTPADGLDRAEADPLRAAVEDYRIKNRCSFEEAWNAVQREKPELFKS